MENYPPTNNSPHETYVGLALVFLSLAGLDSKFDPETLMQLAELIVTAISGLIGVYIGFIPGLGASTVIFGGRG